VVDVASGKEVRAVKCGPARDLVGATFSGDAVGWAFARDPTRFVASMPDETVWLCDLARGQDVARYPAGDFVTESRRVAVTPDGRFAAAATRDRTLLVWRLHDPSK
jgi:hypothetical protein